MDPELTALAASAATAVVNELATTGWQRVQTALGELWRRVHPERVETVEAELAEARAEVLDARRDGDAESERGLIGHWQFRLRRLLAEDPALAAELRRLLAELEPAPDGTGTVITMNATGSDGSRIVQAGRDVHITETGR
ncbi:hypothetical protein [Streptomyces sp. NPDC059564]|uniref:hypothetical protein n=1 Tax=Streptomyces sp. NPDC059564 TaxID=3346865 RepID=UPI00368B8CA4